MSIARLITIIAGLSALCTSACSETPSPAPAVLRLTLPAADELVMGEASDLNFGLALAPEGRHLVFSAVASPHDTHVPAQDTADAATDLSRAELWMRDLATGGLEAIAGTAGGVMPFWSPDGSTLAFFANGKLRALTVSDHSLHDLADAPSPRGGAWHPRGDIVFAPRADGPLMLRRTDGTHDSLTTLAAGEISHRWPRLLGDDHVVFFVRAKEPARQGIWIAPLAAPQARRRLVLSDGEGLPIDTALVYASGDALVVQTVDLETLTFIGPPRLIGSPVSRGTEHQLFATAGGDLLLFGAPPPARRVLSWMDRNGQTLHTVGEPMNATDVRVSPDGAHIAVARVDPQLRTLDIWAYDDRRPVPRRISPAIDADESPVWSADGATVAWVSGRRSVMMRDALGDRSETAVRKFEHPVRLTDWSRDGRWLVASESRPTTGADVIVFSSASSDSSDVRSYAQAPFNETYGALSPDGQWMAYASDESGATEIYVDSFPAPGRRARVTVGGGTEPRWSASGMTLFFRRDSQVHAATLAFTGGAPVAISSDQLLDAGAEIRSFDIADDGGRLLLNLPAPTTGGTALNAVVHIRSLLPSAP